MLGLLPLVPLLSTLTFPEVVTEPRVAQVRLAETLAEADAIESVTADGRAITFAIVRDGEAFDVTAKITKRGEILALAIAPAPSLLVELHGLTWLGAELADVTAVTRLAVDREGAVTLGTNDGRRYRAISGRGTNVAAEARWAAAWSR